MLTIGKIDNTPAKQMYYENQVAASAEEYYTGAGEAPGSWLPTAASSDLGVRGVISREQLQMLMDGRSPATSVQLAQRTESSKIVALDLTFSAPKSISLLYALGDAGMKSELIAAHEAAVREAMAYMEREAGFVRRGKGGVLRFGASFLAAGYRHRTSRELDPQLHTHMVVANMAQGPDGRWTALFGQPIFQHAKAGGAVYQAGLRRRVLELYPRLRWGEVVEGLSELLDVPGPVLMEFSKRRRQIVAEQTRLQMAGVKIGRGGRERINQSTREAKRRIDEATWEKEIRSRAAELGFGIDELERLLQLGPVLQPEPVAHDVLAERLFGPDGLTANSNTFHERDVVIAVASAHRAGASLEDIDSEVRALLADRQVVKIDGGLHAVYSTRELLELEQRVVGQVRAGRGAGIAVLRSEHVESALAAGLPSGIALYDDQAAALRGIVTSGHAIDTVEALAGTGKTTLASAIRVAYEAQGFRVIGAGPTGRARRELSERAGIAGASTLDKWSLRLGDDPASWERVLTHDRDATRQLPTVLVIDEFGMAATRISAKVIDAAIRSGVKVVAIGDSGQLPSVAAGGLLRAITRDETLGSLSLTTVRRQYDQREIELLAQVHDGNPHEYIAWKLAHGDLRVFDGPTPGLDAEAEAVGLLLDARATFGATEALLLTADNERRARINAAVREALCVRGELGEQIELGGGEWAVGDRVIARRNDDRLDVDNGTRGTVIALDPRRGLTVRLDSSEPGRPQLRRLDPGYVGAHVQHAYALTAHGTQGATVQWAAVVGQAGEFFREWAYTALSRARHRTQILLVAEPARTQLARESIAPGDDVEREPLEELAARMSQSRAQELATEQLQQARRDRRSRSPSMRRTRPRDGEANLGEATRVLGASDVLANLIAVLGELDGNARTLELPDLKAATQIIRLRQSVPMFEQAGQVLAAQDAREAIETLTNGLHDAAGSIVLAGHLVDRQHELQADLARLVGPAQALLDKPRGIKARRLQIETALEDEAMDAACEYLGLQARIQSHPIEAAREREALAIEQTIAQERASEHWTTLAARVDEPEALARTYEQASTRLALLTGRSRALLDQIAALDPRQSQIEEARWLWSRAATAHAEAELLARRIGDPGPAPAQNLRSRLEEAKMRERRLLTAARAIDASIAAQVGLVDHPRAAPLYDELARLHDKINAATQRINALGPRAPEIAEALSALQRLEASRERETRRLLTEQAGRLTAMQGRIEALGLDRPDLRDRADQYVGLLNEYGTLVTDERELAAVRADLEQALSDATRVAAAVRKQLTPEPTSIHQSRVEHAPPLFSQSRIELADASRRLDELHRRSVDPRYRQAAEMLAIGERLQRLDAQAQADAKPSGRRDRDPHRERVQGRQAEAKRLRERDADLRAGVGAPPDELVREHANVLAEIRRLDALVSELRERTIAEEIARRERWLTDTLGPVPAEPELAHAWRQTAEQIAELRIERNITDPADPGLRPGDEALVAGLQRPHAIALHR